jgi:RNA polymerase sigma-70 factor (ECF subfamily)
VPFDEIAPIVDRSPDAARQLASRARRRVRAGRTAPDADLEKQREVDDAFLALRVTVTSIGSARCSTADVVLRADFGPVGGSREMRGAAAVAGQALSYAQFGLNIRACADQRRCRRAGTFFHGQPISIAAVTVRNGKIVPCTE